jgi:hypothetical protein
MSLLKESSAINVVADVSFPESAPYVALFRFIVFITVIVVLEASGKDDPNNKLPKRPKLILRLAPHYRITY